MRRLIVLTVVLTSLLVPATALAYNPFTGNGRACQAGGAGSTVCTTNGANDPVNGPNGLLKKVTLVVATLAGIAAMIIILISGFQFITAGGDSQKVARARSTLLGAAIGLVIIILAQAIIVFVLNRVN